MIPRSKMKLKSKGKMFQTSLSALFSRRNEPSQLAGKFYLSFWQDNPLKHNQDRTGDTAMSAPPGIVIKGESSKGQRRRQYVRMFG
jgi:hypothetical protein